MLPAVDVFFGDRAYSYTIRDEIAAHLGDVVSEQGNFSKQILRGRRGRLFQFDILHWKPVDQEARMRLYLTTVVSSMYPQGVSVEGARLFDVGDVDADVIDTVDARAFRFVLRRERQTDKSCGYEVYKAIHLCLLGV